MVSDNPAGDGKIDNLFLQWMSLPMLFYLWKSWSIIISFKNHIYIRGNWQKQELKKVRKAIVSKGYWQNFRLFSNSYKHLSVNIFCKDRWNGEEKNVRKSLKHKQKKWRVKNIELKILETTTSLVRRRGRFGWWVRGVKIILHATALSAVLPSGRNLGRITQMNPSKIARTGHLFFQGFINIFQKEAKIIAVRGFSTYSHLIQYI